MCTTVQSGPGSSSCHKHMLRSLLGSKSDAVGGDVPCCRRQQASLRLWCTATRLNGAIPSCHRALESTQTISAVSARLFNSCGCRSQWPQHGGNYMEVRGQPHAPAALPPRQIISGTHWIGGRAVPRAGLDVLEKG